MKQKYNQVNNESLNTIHYSRFTKDNGDYSSGDHLFPFRTEKLSPLAPMVLR
jgi:hypothetical protein